MIQTIQLNPPTTTTEPNHNHNHKTAQPPRYQLILKQNVIQTIQLNPTTTRRPSPLPACLPELLHRHRLLGRAGYGGEHALEKGEEHLLDGREKQTRAAASNGAAHSCCTGRGRERRWFRRPTPTNTRDFLDPASGGLPGLWTAAVEAIRWPAAAE